MARNAALDDESEKKGVDQLASLQAGSKICFGMIDDAQLVIGDRRAHMLRDTRRRQRFG